MLCTQFEGKFPYNLNFSSNWSTLLLYIQKYCELTLMIDILLSLEDSRYETSFSPIVRADHTNKSKPILYSTMQGTKSNLIWTGYYKAPKCQFLQYCGSCKISILYLLLFAIVPLCGKTSPSLWVRIGGFFLPKILKGTRVQP